MSNLSQRKGARIENAVAYELIITAYWRAKYCGCIKAGHDLDAVDFRRSLRVESKSRAHDLQLAQRFDVADRQGCL
jgi:hypothetical protein